MDTARYEASFATEKSTLVGIAHQRMSQVLLSPKWPVREKVAATCRILFKHGHDSGLAGQITARGEQPGTFLTQRLGLGFDENEGDNLLLVDSDLEVLAGDGTANPANRFHSWIYRASPEVQCVIHTHPIHVCALSIIGTPLKIAQMDACMLYDDVAFLATWPGVPVGNSDGEIITQTLGSKRAARMQLLALHTGRINDLGPLLAREAHDWILHKQRIDAVFHYFARRASRTGARQQSLKP